MTAGRTRVALIYGGRSGEHEVSVESARSVARAIDRTKYDLLAIGIDPDGAWRVAEPGATLPGDRAQRVLPSADPTHPGLMPVRSAASEETSSAGAAVGALSPATSPDLQAIDVAFPVVHGTFGEDGCLQGLFELAGIPYVGSGVPASAVSMDKILMKAVFQAHGFPVASSIAVDRADWEAGHEVVDQIVEHLGFPCFVKPANLGSSVGIQKARDRDQLTAAIDHAAEFSARIIVEQGLDVRELECGVLGNVKPEASVVGEVIPGREFYDYEAKYSDDAGTRFVIPAELPEAVSEQIRGLAVRAFRAIGAAGLARVDFFLERSSGTIYLNEINTIPGFTAMSVYPRLWAASGVPYGELIDRLIALAIERHADQARNRTTFR